MADHGEADPAVSAALAAYARGGHRATVLAALSRSRLLVPVVAVPEPGGGSTEMATVLLTGRDGRTALLAFTGVTALASWRPDARPVPRAVAEVASAALAEGAAAVVVDVAGPVSFTVEGDDLDNLAAGLVLLEADDGYVWALPVRGPGSGW